MKSLYIRYIHSFLRSDRKNALAEGTVYALFAFVMSLVLSVMLSFTISFGEYIDNRYGFSDGYIPCTDDKTIASLTADSRVARYSFADAFAYIDPLTEVTGNITVGTLENGAAELLGLHLISGRMPEAADEIVLEQSVYERLASFTDDGSIALELTYFTGEKVSRTFKTVGVIADYIADRTKSGEEFFTYTEPHKQLPAIICGSSDAPSARHMLIKVADGIDAAQFISGISGDAVLNSRRINSDVDRIRLMFNVLAVLSFIAGVVFLLGSMKLRRPRLAERSRKLKCGELENKAVLRFRICSLLPVALVSCFGGALVGVGGAALTSASFGADRISRLPHIACRRFRHRACRNRFRLHNGGSERASCAFKDAVRNGQRQHKAPQHTSCPRLLHPPSRAFMEHESVFPSQRQACFRHALRLFFHVYHGSPFLRTVYDP